MKKTELPGFELTGDKFAINPQFVINFDYFAEHFFHTTRHFICSIRFLLGIQ